MPIYEFRCRECGTKFEALVPLGGETSVVCEGCGGVDIHKCISSFGIGGGADRTSSSAACAGCSSGSCANCR